MNDGMLEKNFEDDIERWLCEHGGYAKGDPKAFDRQYALDTATLFAFLKETQPKLWARHERNYPGNAERAFLDQFTDNARRRGLLDILRKGLTIMGVKFSLAFWKPDNNLNPETVALYGQNRLHCARQLRYSPASENSLDMVLFLNGIPIVCLELKNPLTGQNADDAVRQFKRDRSPDEPIFRFRERVLVCFAVDPYDARMTTRLNRDKTVFLPFNQGTGGAGCVGGAGNPATAEGYPVAHLWERVLAKDCLLELLRHYLHDETVEEKTASGKTAVKQKLIFPRYHQWDAVRKLLAHAREHGPGRNYLIQHSAGSGKSNSIAWLAHRLSGLHDAADNKIFQGVVIITDRRVLDSQLQATVRQFEQVEGLVVNIDKHSGQLRDALNDGAAIIVTTLQKFPVIHEQVEHTGKNYAIIVDEAHSSQTGQAAAKLKDALADTEAVLAEYARLEGEDEEAREKREDERWREMAAQGQHRNLSFFAFTATPKAATLQIFGEPRPDGKYTAFHVYSMRQAIEEGFILDVLKHYTTYAMYYKLAKKSQDDPIFAAAAAKIAAMQFQSLHPHNISQKTAVILDHFRHVTTGKIGGRAKAMVVTASRRHAVSYMKEFARQIEEKGLKGVKPLVAFSGSVGWRDPISKTTDEYTEVGLNEQVHGRQIPEKQLPSFFHDEFNILLVAEKYQTGFDEPMLHTMFVDKPPSGVKALQTLSRLNRIAPNKEDTFVLDFVNTREGILESFKPFYESTVLEEGTDPNILYRIRDKLEKQGIFTPADVAAFRKALKGRGRPQSLLEKAAATLHPVIERYKERGEEEQDAFKTGLGRFNRLYSFITQICRTFDEELYDFSLFTRKLAAALPRRGHDRVDLNEKIDLEYYKLVKTGEGPITLESDKDGIGGVKGESGGGAVTEYSELSAIIESLNERFQTDFDPADKVGPLRQIRDSLTSDPVLSSLAKQGDEKTLRMVYEQQFPRKVVDIFESNNEFFERLLKDANFLNLVQDQMWRVLLHAFEKKAS